MKVRTITCKSLGLAVMVGEVRPFGELYRDQLACRALAQALDAFREIGKPPPAGIEWLCHVYACCVAATLRAEGFDHRAPLGAFAALCAHAEQFVQTWAACVFEVNPGWGCIPGQIQ